MGRVAQSSQTSNLTLSWALGELRKQLGGSNTQLEAQLQRVAASRADGRQATEAALDRREQARSPEQTSSSSSSMQALGCMTPSGSDVSMHSAGDHHRVRWAEALEQQAGVRLHAPLHAHNAPEKPCLKQQPSAFPFLEEAAQLEGLMRRPRALAQLAAATTQGGSGGASCSGGAKKRNRLAAFGQ